MWSTSGCKARMISGCKRKRGTGDDKDIGVRQRVGKPDG
jgi:hypothetical protein